jgi:hypothetical protein
MIYNLRIWALGHGAGIELTETEYSAIVTAMDRIYIARDIEEKLDLLLENFLEYERDLLSLSLKSSLFTSLDDHEVDLETQLINRRVVNLLSTARMYIDQVCHSAAKLLRSNPDLDLKALFAVEYDTHLEYRVAESLRNFSQHRALPVHQVAWPSAWEEMDSESSRRLRFGLIPSISIDELEAEGGFKASVLKELKDSGKTYFSLTLILRRYLESLATVHAQIRASVSEQAEKDHQVVQVALERARQELTEDLVGLVVTEGADPVHVDEHHFVNERSWRRREFLVKKNSVLNNLSRRYAAAEHPSNVA